MMSLILSWRFAVKIRESGLSKMLTDETCPGDFPLPFPCCDVLLILVPLCLLQLDHSSPWFILLFQSVQL